MRSRLLFATEKTIETFCVDFLGKLIPIVFDGDRRYELGQNVVNCNNAHNKSEFQISLYDTANNRWGISPVVSAKLYQLGRSNQIINPIIHKDEIINACKWRN